VPDRRPSLGSLLLAQIGLPAVLGGIAGFVDPLFPHEPAYIRGVGTFWSGASLGAVLGFLVLLPLTLLLAGLNRPRRPAARLAATATLFLLIPAIVALGRNLYKRIPWGAGDVALGLAGAAGLGLAAVVVAALASNLPRRRETRLVSWTARAAIPALLLALPAAARIASGFRPPTPRTVGVDGAPSLLLLTVDTLRADHLGAMGDPTARTPWFDRICREAALYSNCVAPSPWTLPSLGSVLTGTYPGEHLVLRALSGISAAVPTLAESCRDAGRRTAAFVSNPWLGTGGLARGFDRFDVAERLECLEGARGTRIVWGLAKVALRVGRLESARRLSDQAIAWIERGRGSWFLWVHYLDPHLPNWPEPPFDRLFGPAPRHVGSSLTVDDIRGETYPGGEAGRREIARLYRGEVAYTDREIGRLWKFLEARGDLERTAVVFSADHGEELWDHREYGHGHAMFDEVVRVPLVLRPPGGEAGTVLDGLVSLVDLAPSALGMSGIPAPSDRSFTGRDLRAGAGPGDVRHGTEIDPVAGSAAATYGEATLYGEELKFLRTRRWKLIFRPEPSPGEDARDRPARVDAIPDPSRIRLFDVIADPAERVDLAVAEPAVADSLFRVLQDWMARVGSGGALAARELPETLDPAIRDQLRALGYVR
jgi:arylsulfatase A-like enzyme